MATDLTVRLTDTPGAMAGACEALGQAGINIDGCCAYPAGTAGQLHLLVEDAGAARAALSAAGYEVVQDRTVIVHELEDVPGSAGAALRRIADAGVEPGARLHRRGHPPRARRGRPRSRPLGPRRS